MAVHPPDNPQHTHAASECKHIRGFHLRHHLRALHPVKLLAIMTEAHICTWIRDSGQRQSLLCRHQASADKYTLHEAIWTEPQLTPNGFAIEAGL
jgi:hypothetical protein